MSLYVLFGYIVVDHVGKVFSSSHVLFGQHCTHQSGHNVSKNIWSFWSTKVLTNKDIFCKGIIVLVRHH